MDAELDRFKSDISLSDYAQAEFGYELVKKESSANSKVLKLGGDKIVVTRQQDGHDVYFSTGDGGDSGSIVDFLQKRKSLNLGQVRKSLRAWLPGSKKPAPRMPARPPDRAVAVPRERAEVLRRWAAMKPYGGAYLPGERCIDPQIVEAFGTRQDGRGNAAFAHRDESGGVTGWELKNAGFTGFSAGGERRISWARLDAAPVRRIVFCESSIDAMSYAQIKHEPGTAYISTGGAQLSQAQREQIGRALAGDRVLVLAMDRDEAGEQMAREIAAMAPASARIVRDVPRVGKDWNEALQAAEDAEEEQERSRDMGMRGG